MTARTFRDLEAWQEGVELAMRVYECTDQFPTYERFGLASQMCRAAVSIPANIAEGECKSRREFLHHVSHSRGSLQELMTFLVIASRRNYGSLVLLNEIQERADHEGKLLYGLRRFLIART